MPLPSKIQLMRDEDRKELDRRLIQSGFSGYEALSEWLGTKGYEISKSTIGYYGKKFKGQLEKLKERTEQSKAICEAVGDDENQLANAVSAIALLKVLEAMDDLDIDEFKKNPEKVLALAGTLTRSSVTVKKYQAEIRKRTIETAEEVAFIGKQKGLSDESAALIRAKILGIAP